MAELNQTFEGFMSSDHGTLQELKPFNIDAGILTLVALDSAPGPFVLSASRVDKFSVVHWDHRHFNMINSGAEPFNFSYGNEILDDGSLDDPFGMATVGAVGLGVSVFDDGTAQATLGPTVEGTGFRGYDEQQTLS